MHFSRKSVTSTKETRNKMNMTSTVIWNNMITTDTNQTNIKYKNKDIIYTNDPLKQQV